MLVVDLADDLLDEVLQRHDPGGASVLVDDDGELQPGFAQAAQQRVEGHRLRHDRCVDEDVRDRQLSAVAQRDADGLLDVDQARDVVDVLAHHRKPRVPRADRGVEDGLHRLLGVQELHLRAGLHHLAGREATELDGAGEEFRGRLVQGPLLPRAARDRLQLLGRACLREFLGGFEPEHAHDAVGAVVEELDGPPEDGHEHRVRPDDELGHAHRLGDAPVLGDELAEHHLAERGDDERRTEREAGGGGARVVEGAEGGTEQRGDRGFGDEADHQARHGDAELRSGELARQGPEVSHHPCRARVTGVGLTLHRPLVDGEIRELDRDEEGVESDEEDDAAGQDPGRSHGPRVRNHDVGARTPVKAPVLLV
ncbi:hypothetical protein GCM10025883_41620 [Mobilicoccus caccae]|uniref:Uncharacterized protein n=1 Tax=Mobilicoccus caccae TaxID=1859295 RepID=A0ABQ6IW27_9MICO|nr:hypothetical protein [Mobilicoccus caccae]GMA42117.1 hypothetical protein GCM10025883_41620 [Mobilicoccus caccae]